MKFIDEYRQGDIAKKLAEQIAGMTGSRSRSWRCAAATLIPSSNMASKICSRKHHDDSRAGLSGLRHPSGTC